MDIEFKFTTEPFNGWFIMNDSLADILNPKDSLAKDCYAWNKAKADAEYVDYEECNNSNL